jgi:phosphoribosylformimino-5-aminoimidazole carboxamide ribotide isomerase
MTLFRPVIDLHQGKVKQIVGATLSGNEAEPETNFVSDRDAAWYARLYRDDGLQGGHVIMLGPGNESAARAALAAYPGGLQIGGGITPENAASWLDAGASHVVLTSWIFDGDGRYAAGRLEEMVHAVGAGRLVIDLSCRRTGESWTVACNRWQTLTDLAVEEATLDRFAETCAEYLIHAVDVEGLQAGIAEDLVARLGAWGKIPVTYAGGANSMSDLDHVNRHSRGAVDLAIGSALDIFGGRGIAYKDCVAYNRNTDEDTRLPQD